MKDRGYDIFCCPSLRSFIRKERIKHDRYMCNGVTHGVNLAGCLYEYCIVLESFCPHTGILSDYARLSQCGFL